MTIDHSPARRLFEEALEAARERAEKGATAEALYGLGQLERTKGYTERALMLHGEALGLEHGIGRAPRIAASLEAFAGLAAEGSDYQHAARLLGAAHVARQAHDYARSPWESSRYERDLALIRDRLSTEEFDTAFAQGAVLSVDEAVAQALEGREPETRRITGWRGLTERATELAGLVAEGLTNPEIAERLVISAETVKTHLSNIFAKLGVARRRELEREVLRHGSIPDERGATKRAGDFDNQGPA
jgi:DNA-binding CsgD family transcriptional regulator